MKFVVSSTDLLSHLQLLARVADSTHGGLKFNFKDIKEPLYINRFILEFTEQDEDVSKQVTLHSSFAEKSDYKKLLYSFYKSSVKELLRQMQLYSSAALSLFNFCRLSHFTSITLLFGLCCSSSTYVFDAIVSSNSLRIPSL